MRGGEECRPPPQACATAPARHRSLYAVLWLSFLCLTLVGTRAPYRCAVVVARWTTLVDVGYVVAARFTLGVEAADVAIAFVSLFAFRLLVVFAVSAAAGGG